MDSNNFTVETADLAVAKYNHTLFCLKQARWPECFLYVSLMHAQRQASAS